MSELENKKDVLENKVDSTSEQLKEGVEQAEKLHKEREDKAEKAHETEKTAEDARKEVEQATAEKEKKDDHKKEASPAEQRKAKLLDGRHANKKLVFKKTMAEARSHMSPASKAFSSVIHNPVVEKTSEAVGATVARPNAILSGSLFALVFTTAVYLWANYAGYGLSGFETIAAFIVGWLVGIIFDYVRIMITGKQ